MNRGSGAVGSPVAISRTTLRRNCRPFGAARFFWHWQRTALNPTVDSWDVTGLEDERLHQSDDASYREHPSTMLWATCVSLVWLLLLVRANVADDTALPPLVPFCSLTVLS